MRTSQLTVLCLAAAVGLAGCASPSAPGPAVPSPSATASAPADAEQARETGLTRPALAFNGQCDLLFSDAQLSSVMGAPLALTGNHWDEFWGGDALFAEYGGFECTWISGNARVIALVLPEAAVDYTPQDYECTETHDSSLMSCPMESIVNGLRISGLATLGQDPVAATVARDALLAIFTDKATGQAPVPVPLAAVGSWSLTLDCAGLAAGADFSAVPGLGAGAVDVGALGAGKDISQAESALVATESACAVQGDSAMVSFIPVGGARWTEERVAARPEASPLALDGVDAAYGVPYADGTTLVYAYSGPNLLMFQVRYTKNAAAFATALFASLDATAVT